jgi:hypothetical protein
LLENQHPKVVNVKKLHILNFHNYGNPNAILMSVNGKPLGFDWLVIYPFNSYPRAKSVLQANPRLI